MNTNIKKAILIFGGGLLLYWAFTKIKPIGSKSKSTIKSDVKSFSDEDIKKANIVLTAYKEAMKAGESKSFLEEMNVEFAKEFGSRVQVEKGSSKPFVADLDGNKVM
jgi:hypothetical protein